MPLVNLPPAGHPQHFATTLVIDLHVHSSFGSGHHAHLNGSLRIMMMFLDLTIIIVVIIITTKNHWHRCHCRQTRFGTDTNSSRGHSRGGAETTNIPRDEMNRSSSFERIMT